MHRGFFYLFIFQFNSYNGRKRGLILDVLKTLEYINQLSYKTLQMQKEKEKEREKRRGRGVQKLYNPI